MSRTCLRRSVLTLCLISLCAVPLDAQLFVDDFERADGPVDGWTEVGGPWAIQDGELVAGPPTGAEMDIFAGDPALVLPENYRLSFDVRSIAPSNNAVVGRHFGVYVNYQNVANRNPPNGNGYGIWWIDRDSDKGINLGRRTNGAFAQLVPGPGAGAAPEDPPGHWVIEVVGKRIRVFGDGVLYIDHVDGTYRGGRIAMWNWNGAEQITAFDNVVVEGIVLADTFDRDPLRNYTGAGTWRYDEATESLQNGPSSTEEHLFHDTPLPEEYELSLDWAFLAEGNNAVVGKHAGLLFNYLAPTARNGSGGYQLHWIDRAQDKGFNLIRYDGGTPTALQIGTGDLFEEPPTSVRVEVDGPTIRVYGDDVLAIEVDDETYRGGLAGFWTWSGAESIQVDNFSVTAGGETVISDDFSPSAPLEQWIEIPDGGNWAIVSDESGSRLRAGPPSGTPQSIFGAPLLPDEWVASVDISWVAPDDGFPGVGRHGGVFFNYGPPSQRNVGSGYHLWWIDRESDRGWNLYKIVNGAGTPVASGNTEANDVNGTLTIERSGDDIIVSQNGDPVLTHTDGQFKGGQIGFWTWEGNGQTVDFDNVLVVGTPVTVDACLEVTTPGPLTTDTAVTFDANCTFGQVELFSWDFGDGESATGSIVDHTYAAPGVYTVTLTAEGGGNADSISTEVTINAFEPYDCEGSAATDDFEDGELDGWTSTQGTWVVDGGRVVLGPTSAESELFLDQSLPTDELVIEFDMEMLQNGTAGIGRHAAVYFLFDNAGNRYAGNTRGYQLWWIDRASDYGLNLARWDGGGLAHLVPGTGDLFPQPPSRYRIEVFGDNIKIYGDDILAIDFNDGTYRGGRFALWAYSDSQLVAWDNICIDGPPVSACFTVGNDCAPPIAGGEVTFDASCTSFLKDGAGEGATYSWDFGDGEGAEGAGTSHAFAAPGTYEVTLTVDLDGRTASTTQTVTVSEFLLSYENTFDGDALDDVSIVGGGGWRLEDGALANGPTGANGEEFIFMGSPAAVAPAEAVYEFDFVFTGPGSVPAIGRHAGFQFCVNRVAARGGFSGYFIDWIDRESDRGPRLTRVDNGGFVELVSTRLEPAPEEPPTSYRVETTPTHVRVWGDDVLYYDLADATHRGGHFGFWSWVGGNEFVVDNLIVEGSASVQPCFDCSADGTVILGDAVEFDASCTDDICGFIEIASYEWDFGDGSEGASGVTASHTYASGGIYTVTVTITDADDNAVTATKEVFVQGESLPFVDCFERDRGVLTGWTVLGSPWQTFGNGTAGTSTTTGAPDAESWAWFGDPAGLTTADNLSMQFDVVSASFTGAPFDPVKRHFGAMFYANTPTSNRFAADSRGYVVWWIDRESDFGISLARFDGAGFTFLQSGTGDLLADPPTNWRIECDATHIRVYGDDTLYVEVEDSTYRSGHAGLWAWKNVSLTVDNVKIGTGEDYPDCPSLGGLQKPCDFNQDGNFDLSDAVGVLNHLFLGGVGPACGDGTLADPSNIALLDANGSGLVDLSDAVYKLNFLFTGGPPPMLGEDCVLIEDCPDVCAAP